MIFKYGNKFILITLVRMISTLIPATTTTKCFLEKRQETNKKIRLYSIVNYNFGLSGHVGKENGPQDQNTRRQFSV